MRLEANFRTDIAIHIKRSILQQCFPGVSLPRRLRWLSAALVQVASYEFTTLTCVPGVFNYKATSCDILSQKTVLGNSPLILTCLVVKGLMWLLQAIRPI